MTRSTWTLVATLVASSGCAPDIDSPWTEVATDAGACSLQHMKSAAADELLVWPQPSTVVTVTTELGDVRVSGTSGALVIEGPGASEGATWTGLRNTSAPPPPLRVVATRRGDDIDIAFGGFWSVSFGRWNIRDAAWTIEPQGMSGRAARDERWALLEGESVTWFGVVEERRCIERCRYQPKLVVIALDAAGKEQIRSPAVPISRSNEPIAWAESDVGATRLTVSYEDWFNRTRAMQIDCE